MSRDREDDRRGGRDRDDSRGSRDRNDRGSRDREGSSGRDRDDRGSRDRDDRGDDRRGGRDRGDDRDEQRSSGSSRGYQYRERSADESKERASRGAKDYDKMLKPGIKVWSPGDGDNRVRPLPPTWDGAKHYGIDVYVHYGVGPDRESYLCPREHDRGKCPICEEREEARRARDPDEEYVRELEAKRRVLAYVVDRKNEREGVQAWMMPWTIDKDIVKVSFDKESGEVLPIDHPQNGYDVMFDKSGKGLKTKYEGVTVGRRPSPLGRDAWMDFAMDNPLPDQLQFYDYDHIAKTFGAKGQQRDSRDRDDRGGDRDRGDDRGGRDRDDRGDDRGGRDARDDVRGRERDDGRGRERDAGRDERGGRDRDDRGGGRDRREDVEPTWESVHAMTRTELEDLVEYKTLPIKPREAKDDEDLADWICEEMKLEKPARGGRARMDDPPPARERDSGGDRLADMRRRRDD